MVEGADAGWARALTCLSTGHPDAHAPWEQAVGRLRAAGGVPFEVVTGTPTSRYGGRLTFRAAAPGAGETLARAAGLHDHPWGVPDWVGVRTTADGGSRTKGYHRRPPPLGTTTVHRGLPVGLEPVMASLDGDALEVYAVEPGESRWDGFVARCLLPLGLDREPPLPGPRPVPARRGFGASAQHVGDALVAVTLYAFASALPADEAVRAAWTLDLDDEEAGAYEAALAAVRSLGRSTRRLHALLAWTVHADGQVLRAASLRVPTTG